VPNEVLGLYRFATNVAVAPLVGLLPVVVAVAVGEELPSARGV